MQWSSGFKSHYISRSVNRWLNKKVNTNEYLEKLQQAKTIKEKVVIFNQNGNPFENLVKIKKLIKIKLLILKGL